MKAQTQRTDETRRPVAQVTPVIIKSGGGGGDPTKHDDSICAANPMLLFNGLGKIFDSRLTDNTWRTAKSSGPAAIMSVEISEGGHTFGPFNASLVNELSVLEVTYATDTLVINELHIDHQLLDTIVAVTSPVPFTVLKGGAEADQWTKSDAPFPVAAPLVTFSQGGIVIAQHQCKSCDVTLTVNLNWDGKAD